MHGDERYPRFFAYLNLFLASMLILVLGQNLLTLFLGWELVGLSSYLLIGFWFEKRRVRRRRQEGVHHQPRRRRRRSWSRCSWPSRPSGPWTSSVLVENAETLASGTAFALVLLLPRRRHREVGPDPAVRVAARRDGRPDPGVGADPRRHDGDRRRLPARAPVAGAGAVGRRDGGHRLHRRAHRPARALIAVRQDDIKKILAYSTVSQLGFMFIAVGVGAFRESIFHLVTHAFFKGLLFLAAGSVMHAMANRTDIWQMGGLRKAMPITFWTAACRLAGDLRGPAVRRVLLQGPDPHRGLLPRLRRGVDHRAVAAILTAFYMSRWFFLIFLGEPRYGTTSTRTSRRRSMTIPLIVLAVLSTVGGVALNAVHTGPLYRFLEPTVGPIGDLGYEPYGPLEESVLIPLAIVAAVIGIGLAYLLYLRATGMGARMAEPITGPLAELAERKFFVDEAYEALFVTAGGGVARAMVWFDTRVIDGIVNGAGAGRSSIGRGARRAQSGLVRRYVAVLVLGALALLAVLMVQVR
jgi:NADH-quinone oxidoreductase subunit L